MEGEGGEGAKVMMGSEESVDGVREIGMERDVGVVDGGKRVRVTAWWSGSWEREMG